MINKWEAYAYLDAAQEAKRIAAAASAISEAELKKRRDERAHQKKTNAAWSDRLSKKEEKEKRREKSKKKKKWLKEHQPPTEGEATEPGTKRARGADEGSEDGDWAELAREERMAKKVKRGGVSQATFDAEFGDLEE